VAPAERTCLEQARRLADLPPRARPGARTHRRQAVSGRLEPLDFDSWVTGSAGPRTFRLDRPETLDVIGRVRAVVGARDGIWSGVDRMVPWEIGMEWAGERVVCRDVQ
jgi:hypothetical protein